MLCILCSVGNIVTISSYHGRPARWFTPFRQPACRLHLYSRVYFLSWQINSAAADAATAEQMWLKFSTGTEVYPGQCVWHFGVDRPRGPSRAAGNASCGDSVSVLQRPTCSVVFTASTSTDNSTSTALQDYCYGCKFIFFYKSPRYLFRYHCHRHRHRLTIIIHYVP